MRKRNLSLIVAVLLMLSALAQAHSFGKFSAGTLRVAGQSSQQKRLVTVTVKRGPPVKGTFLRSDGKTVRIDLGGGQQVEIGLDEIVSIAFSEPPSIKEPAGQPLDAGVARAAINALRALGAATEVGVGYREYGRRVIDTDIVVKDFLTRIPAGKLKSEIDAAMADYKFALVVWQDLINSSKNGELGRTDSDFIYSRNPLFKIILSKYPDIRKTDLSGDQALPKDYIFGAIWRSAIRHIENAEGLL